MAAFSQLSALLTPYPSVPCTLIPTPCALHPAPYPLCPAPYPLCPAPSALTVAIPSQLFSLSVTLRMTPGLSATGPKYLQMTGTGLGPVGPPQLASLGPPEGTLTEVKGLQDASGIPVGDIWPGHWVCVHSPV